MKKLIFVLLLLCSLEVNAQNYLISFEASGAASTVESVTVANLTKKTTLNLAGSDVLRLTTTTSIAGEQADQRSEIKIYPNPVTESSVMEFIAPVSGDALISVYDLAGRRIAQTSTFIENSHQQFRLSGIEKGFYSVVVEGSNFSYSAKMIGSGAKGFAKIEKLASDIQNSDTKISRDESKGTAETKDMEYTDGDLLQFAGTNGNNTTIVMDVPVADKTIHFVLVECKDGDNNYYPVVKIGDQTWMAKNLAATKFTSGTSLAYVTTDIDWKGLTYTDKAFCYYGNSTSNGSVYGALYTWIGAMNGAASSTNSPSGVQGVCPVGWHLPSWAEWLTLETAVGGSTNGGIKLKETGFTHWMFNIAYTPGTNESGFTGLGGGYRLMSNGSSDGLKLFGAFWTATEVSANVSYFRFLQADNGAFTVSSGNKKDGYSVRCIKD